ncbi:MAG: hypothetical protein M0027_02225 [Candidatus Dormibacteraeota bacterium]|nr:hypothetical protein [Candidatus Dormibacteraeota bacterium]
MRTFFRITERSSGAQASCEFPGPRLAGDPRLCHLVRPYLDSSSASVVVVGGAAGPTGRGRRTIVRTLEPGSEGWAAERLTRAAERWDLDLREEWM